MKANILLFLFFSLLFLQITPAQNVEPQFSELKGFEDSQNNTHLFYRIYSSSESGFRNDIYRWNLSTGQDTFFLGEGGQTSPPLLAFSYTDDYDFWSLDSLEYIYCGSHCGIECGTYVQRSDTNAVLPGGDFGRSLNINIGVDPNTIFYGLDGWTTLVKSMKSTDGGFNWTELSDQYYFYTLSPFNDEISFYLNDNGDLFKSTDGGASFYQVNTIGASIYGEDTDFYFDQDSNHIYLNYFDHTNYYFSVSNNFGESNSWQIKKISNVPIHLSNDSQNGVIFLAEGEMIYKSTDYGDTFTLFNTLEDDIIDIYKKPGSEIVYAATKYRIYKVTTNTISILKQLTDPTEKYKWVPLEIGNMWVYDSYWIDYDPGFPPTYHYAGTKYIEVVADTIIENNSYFIVESDILSQQVFEPKMFLRVDSTSGIIYKYWESLNDEFPFHDLDAEVGDTIYNPENPGQPFYILQNEEPIEFFGTNTFIREYSENLPCNCMHSLVQDYGLTYAVFEEYGGSEDNLKGAVIGGVVYGDTSFVVSVEEELDQKPTEFKLHQNYPNPFNPSTKIKYEIPFVGSRDRVLVQIQIYDVLGNEVATLVDEYKPAGSFEVEFNTGGLPSGVYFYRLSAGNFVETRKMVLQK